MGFLSPRTTPAAPMFATPSRRVAQAAVIAVELFGGPAADRPALAVRVAELEAQVDADVSGIEAVLDSAHITPFDRPDAFTLAHQLDECLDELEAACDLVSRLPLRELPRALTTQVEALATMTALAADSLARLTSIRTARATAPDWAQIHRLANQVESHRRDLLVACADEQEPRSGLLALRVGDRVAAAAAAIDRVGTLVRTIALKGA